MPTSVLAYLKALLASLAAVTISITPASTSGLTGQSNQSQNTTNISSGTSHNWSGYETTNGNFTSITGTWTIPQATSSGHTAMDATWVGIGGIKNSDLIQSGTQNIVNASGQVTTSAFYEVLPQASQSLPVSVKTGDSITVTITQQSSNQWLIKFNDNTTGQNNQTTVSYTSSLSSAEWVEEAPSSGRIIIPLDNFSAVQFTAANTTENGNNVTIAGSNGQAITMINNRRQVLATPSVLEADGASFSITRSTASANSPIPYLDRNPRGWRRRGIGIGSFYPYVIRRWHAIIPSITLFPSQQSETITVPTQTESQEPTEIPAPTQIPQPAMVSSQSAFIIHRRFGFPEFGFKRRFFNTVP